MRMKMNSEERKVEMSCQLRMSEEPTAARRVPQIYNTGEQKWALTGLMDQELDRYYLWQGFVNKA